MQYGNIVQYIQMLVPYSLYYFITVSNKHKLIFLSIVGYLGATIQYIQT